MPPKKFMNQLVSLDGIEKTVAEWVSERKLSAHTVYARKKIGTPWPEALTKKRPGHAYRTGYVISPRNA